MSYFWHPHHADASSLTGCLALACSWSDFYRLVAAHGANFTHLLRYNLSDPYDLGANSPGVAGYANLTTITPEQIFPIEDILLLQDGLCASTCAVFAEFMKSQAHVKSVVMGERAQTGPMQAVGGVKGADIYYIGFLQSLVTQAFGLADPQKRAELQQKYEVEIQTFPAAAKRAFRDGDGYLQAAVNVKNNIRQGDGSLTPLQFVYQAADCRLFYEPVMILNQSLVWKAGYAALWGEGKCVEGSTGQASSDLGLITSPTAASVRARVRDQK